MDFDDLIVERAPVDELDRHFYEGAVMLAYAMHLLRTEPVREVCNHRRPRQRGRVGQKLR
ncbi:hypothetical protein H8A97_36395 [Bradyrhizobium sp. Arg62]|uniref:hypothetical protein n=1 Tax=Bradyrhizobium brasilense TaxID=1419277 RepID=UPI001E466BA0|nr:hypothetical protein [Bradyrhizobium brasilense]MCC8950408.1 hypothetical protein [Bradyrhizobium brasilense]